MPQNKYEAVPQKIESVTQDSVADSVVMEKAPQTTEQSVKALPEEKTEQEVPTPKEQVQEEGAPENNGEEKEKEDKENKKTQETEGSEDQSKKEAKAENGEKSPEKAILGEITKEATEIARAIDKNPEVKKRGWLKNVALAYLIFTGGSTLTTAMDGYLAKAQEGSPTDEKATSQKATQNYAEEAFNAIKGAFAVSEAEAGSSFDKSLARSLNTVMRGTAKGASRSMERQAERLFNGGMTTKEEDRVMREAEKMRKDQIKREQKWQDGQIQQSRKAEQGYQKQNQDIDKSIWKQRESAIKAYQKELKKAKTPADIEMAKMKYQEMLRAINEM